MAVVLKTTPVADGHTEVGPVIAAGVPGFETIASVLAGVPAPHALLATTDTFPLMDVEGTVMSAEVPLLTTVQPAGAVQV